MKVFVIQPRKAKWVFWGSVAVLALQVFTFPFLAGDIVDVRELTALNGACIVIDPGHGGFDAGASRQKHIEKEINLAISLKLAEIVSKAGAHVVMTRESDIDYYERSKGKGGKRRDIERRIDIINGARGNVYISIHANAIPASRWTGAQVFYNPALPESKFLAEAMQEALKDFPPGNKRQAKQDLNILLLNRTTIPGVLIETGYLSNPQEAKHLSDPNYQQNMAYQIAKGLAYYFSRNAGR
ncbi:N-acetylmuramoyl-L-alanine amidase [Acetonema longum]|uniref:Germination specific N-acetylmuramoyl-L-alanine amidase n=1 Tax=Acetonema longum DSM 6540 TaxID=1009370 RepID=F7NF58_9FIRM|nr:N-acetylmuramoyl-L-alanine amidase [Acetonema longum]EGO65313.1 germination specific N-acetylmuramoyl-L-alanine amidase [Acetonema longum DSM 6540]